MSETQAINAKKISEKFVYWDKLFTLEIHKNNLWIGEIPQKWIKTQATLFPFFSEIQGQFF